MDNAAERDDCSTACNNQTASLIKSTKSKLGAPAINGIFALLEWSPFKSTRRKTLVRTMEMIVANNDGIEKAGARANPIVMVAAFPPPLGGASKNSEYIRNDLQRNNCKVIALSTAAKTLSHNRTICYHLQRVLRNLRVFMKLCWILPGRRKTVYMVPDGGAGLLYFVWHFTIARLTGSRIILHHRTFRYIDNHTFLMRFIVQMGRKTTTHVFLSPGMRDKFSANYGDVQNLVCTNAVFIDDAFFNESKSRSGEPLTFGHLSNLSRDKGFYEVVDFFIKYHAIDPTARLLIAGPAQDESVDAKLKWLLETYKDHVEVFGSVYGQQKAEFYKKLDVFLFPTRFRQEAQPNVVYEALAAGVPVFTTAKGCIPEMVKEGDGLVCPSEESFSDAAIAKLQQWNRNGNSTWACLRQGIQERMHERCEKSRLQYQQLINYLTNEQ